MIMRFYEFEAGFYLDFARFLYELNLVNIKEQIKRLVIDFEREFKGFDEEKFKKEIENFKVELNR